MEDYELEIRVPSSRQTRRAILRRLYESDEEKQVIYLSHLIIAITKEPERPDLVQWVKTIAADEQLGPLFSEGVEYARTEIEQHPDLPIPEWL